MNEQIKTLQPSSLWKNFSDLNAVPRASKKEERVIAFMKKFGEDLGLETRVDHIGNVIIKKPASVGMEDRQTVVLQSHLDMVHQKNRDTQFDFETEGIKMIVDNDWVKADGTTLGADNGIGVATIMSVLESSEIEHPPLEALFTIDEETGMTGALELRAGELTGSILLNLDTEDDDELTIGCAGGIDITGEGTCLLEDAPHNSLGYEINVRGLTGGHSGMDIHKGRGNANKIMNRILYTINAELNLAIAMVDGGGLRNAIPRESMSIIAIDKSRKSDFEILINKISAEISAEFNTTDPDMTIELVEVEAPEKVINKSFQNRFLNGLYSLPSGIYRMSPDIPDLVQTSNNLARVLLKEGKYKIMCLCRSSVDTEKFDMANSIKSAMELIGASVRYGGSYPGWQPKPEADIVKIMSDLYRQKFNEEPHVNACHAGLECGILGTNYPEMDMISFGPNIRGAHSPDEKVQISSVQKFWDYFLLTLKEIPKQN
jgi:dipeptidase D